MCTQCCHREERIAEAHQCEHVLSATRLKDLQGIRFLQKAGSGGHGRPQKKTGMRGQDK